MRKVEVQRGEVNLGEERWTLSRRGEVLRGEVKYGEEG